MSGIEYILVQQFQNYYFQKKLNLSCTIRREVYSSCKSRWGTYLMVQWLNSCLPIQVVQVRSLVRELRSHMLRGQKIKQNKT